MVSYEFIVVVVVIDPTNMLGSMTNELESFACHNHGNTLEYVPFFAFIHV